jgi:two-component system chemotaxis sensor kinase CheA
VHRVESSEVLRLRDRVIPLVRAERMFGRTGAHESGNGNGGNGHAAEDLLCVVVIGVGEKRVGLVVDELLGQEETVIKPLGSYLKHIPGVAGATIGGDGRVRLILDPGAVAGASDDSAALLERMSA